jgi:L-alanine-DL-glutamate epimerase-like enolase superfamily enzyme
MRIRQITAAVIEANDWTIVRVASDDGVLGWSEAFCVCRRPSASSHH